MIRMHGAVAAHPASVIRPLLLPDSPVVIWWPGKAPNNQAADELAQLAMRRVTDAASAARPLAALKARARDYTPGDTDLSWTRLTRGGPCWPPHWTSTRPRSSPWSSRLSAVIPPPTCSRLAAFPAEGRGDTQDQQWSRDDRGAHDHRVRRYCDHSAGRPAGLLRRTRPAERLVALKRRNLTELISEELRRMDPDEVYERTAKSLLDDKKRTTAKPRCQEGRTKKTGGKKADSHARVPSRQRGAGRWPRQPRDLAPCRTR